jgi:hypothetical protein
MKPVDTFQIFDWRDSYESPLQKIQGGNSWFCDSEIPRNLSDSDWFQMILVTLVVLRILRIQNDSDNFKQFQMIPLSGIDYLPIVLRNSVWFRIDSEWFWMIPYWFWLIPNDFSGFGDFEWF